MAYRIVWGHKMNQWINVNQWPQNETPVNQRESVTTKWISESVTTPTWSLWISESVLWPLTSSATLTTALTQWQFVWQNLQHRNQLLIYVDIYHKKSHNQQTSSRASVRWIRSSESTRDVGCHLGSSGRYQYYLQLMEQTKTLSD